MPDLNFNFLNTYQELPLVVVPLSVINYTNTHTTSCYCGDIDTVVCYPLFDNLPTQLDFIENWGYFIDFGDGTISNELTARHSYSVPGKYTITLVVSDSASNLYRSAVTPMVEAYNLIPDTLSITYLSGSIATAGVPLPLLLTRHSSFQTYKSLSGIGYSVKLSVSGNISTFQTQSSYNSDANSHLKKFSAFTKTPIVNPVEEIQTTCDLIYAQVNPLTDDILLFPSPTLAIPGVSTVFVGTSGIATIYYYEDI